MFPLQLWQRLFSRLHPVVLRRAKARVNPSITRFISVILYARSRLERQVGLKSCFGFPFGRGTVWIAPSTLKSRESGHRRVFNRENRHEYSIQHRRGWEKPRRFTMLTLCPMLATDS